MFSNGSSWSPSATNLKNKGKTIIQTFPGLICVDLFLGGLLQLLYHLPFCEAACLQQLGTKIPQDGVPVRQRFQLVQLTFDQKWAHDTYLVGGIPI